MNALLVQEQERRRLASDYLDWRLARAERLDIIGRRQSRAEVEVPSWVVEASKTPRGAPRQISHRLPLPMAEHGWQIR